MKKEQQDNIWGPAKFNREMKSLGELTSSFGLPRLIITGFLVLLFILAPVAGVDFFTQITNVANRFSWNAVMVLAMVPMIHSGCGLNFGLPLGLVSGLLGATLSIQFGFTGAYELRDGNCDCNAVCLPVRRRLRLAAQQDQGRRDDDCDVCRLLRPSRSCA